METAEQKPIVVTIEQKASEISETAAIRKRAISVFAKLDNALHEMMQIDSFMTRYKSMASTNVEQGMHWLREEIEDLKLRESVQKGEMELLKQKDNK